MTTTRLLPAWTCKCFSANISLLLVVLGAVLILTGCNNTMVVPGSKEGLMYQKAVAALNQKAQSLMTSGDSNGAVCRLESALDLLPEEPQTMSNLAIAYHSAERYPQAITLYEKMAQKQPAKAGFYLKYAGISFEAQGDKLMSMVSDPALSNQAKDNRKAALDSYNQAITRYESALSDRNGLNEQDAKMLDAQMKNLQTQIQRIKSGEV
ncbi:MAG: hypothetical protein VKJ04_04590 [Vampirovibrionales bacterium]|nr:hypothetical protein [Vampirovibrionales bacterium]